MGPQRFALGIEVGRDIDGVGELGFGHAERIAVVGTTIGVELLVVDHRRARFACQLHHPHDVISIHRRFEDALDAGKLGGAMADGVDLDVIRVPVVAVPVVDRHDIGVLLAEDLGQALGGVIHGSLEERLRIVVLLPPGHTAVFVTEPFDTVDAERRCRPGDLGSPPVDERFTVGEVIGHLAVLPVGGDDQHHSVALGAGPRQRSTGADRLVIGVSVKADQCSHQASL